MSITFIKRLLFSLVLSAGLYTTATADFYVIPVNKKIEHVILVAKKGGDFTDVKEAIESITDANETNRYLVYVGPGVYHVTSPIVMKSWVTLKGSGENATLLKGAVSTGSNYSSAILSSWSANNATITELSVENTGGDTFSIGVYITNDSTVVANVKATASGGAYNYGIYNYYSSSTLTNVTATASGGVTNSGVYNYYSSPTLTNVTATASGGGNSIGINNIDSASAPKIFHSIVTGEYDDVHGGTPMCYYTLGIVGTTYKELNATCK